MYICLLGVDMEWIDWVWADKRHEGVVIDTA